MLSEAERVDERSRRISRCQACGSDDLAEILDFGHQPPVHSFLRREQLGSPEVSYPLRLVRCGLCTLVQLGDVVDPRIVFPPEYPYLTGLTAILRADFQDLANQAVSRLGLRPGDLAVDIGSNDGTLLDAFRAYGLRVVGVEPTDVATIANDRQIPTVQAFFDADVARRIVAEHGLPKIVTATNVIAHVDRVGNALDAIALLLGAGGVFVSESHYLLELVERLQYDTIYHEHLRYYSLGSFDALLARHGFRMTDAQRVPTHGGSVRVWAVRDGAGARSASVERLVQEEQVHGLHLDATLARFRTRVVASKHAVLELLLRLKREGARVAGVGAPARSSMLLNTCHIDADVLDFIAEQPSSPKVGLYTPGTHVPVSEESRLIADAPDYALILSWHIGDEVMRKLRKDGYRGTFVVPLPEPRVVAEA